MYLNVMRNLIDARLLKAAVAQYIRILEFCLLANLLQASLHWSSLEMACAGITEWLLAADT